MKPECLTFIGFNIAVDSFGAFPATNEINSCVLLIILFINESVRMHWTNFTTARIRNMMQLRLTYNTLVF